jgi:uncharacterized protein
MPSSVTRPPLVVLDTNLVLSALLFANGRVAPLRLAWQGGQCLPLTSKATATELMRVLAYPKFKLSADDREQLLADYLPYCRSVRMPPRMPARWPKLPQCRDATDQMFLELAAVGEADFLVTGDKDLLALASQFKCPIMAPASFLERLQLG